LGKAFDKSGLSDLHFHDLRGTAVTRLVLSNCTVPEIAAITGHSLELSSKFSTPTTWAAVELAESAIKKLDAVYG